MSQPPLIVGYMGQLVAESDGQTVIGNKTVGKDEVASQVARLASSSGWDVVTLAFADALKDEVERLFALPRSFYDQPQCKERWLEDYSGYRYRTLLTLLGSDVVRHFQPCFWVDVVKKKLQQELTPLTPLWTQVGVSADVWQARWHAVGLPLPLAPRRKLIQITDVRFPEEYDMLRSFGARLVCVTRRGRVQTELDAHGSNQQQPSLVPDLTFDNNESLSVLKQRIPELWSRLQM